MSDSEIHKQQTEDRKKYTEIILNSSSKKKIIVAGPGTGKSFTFNAILTLKGTPSLALTFINNLAGDLAKDLTDLADVHTFHGYCKSILHKVSVDGIDSHFHYYPKLTKIIETDADILENNLSQFEKAIQTLDEGDEIKFYINRANYYNSVSHNDAVYRVLKYFEANQQYIPKFNQIVVDEYQDFNPLEVAFIDQLAITSPVLIAGDDDQALYWFKHASSEHIRGKRNNGEYECFELPYCSRCTLVIVSSVLEIIKKAVDLGRLANRIDKKYICFLPQKEEDSQTYPKITHAACSIQNKQDTRNYIGKFIESEIKKIPQEEIDLAKKAKYPCVLIVGQKQYLKQVHSYLKSRFKNIDFKESLDENIDLLDAYLILLHNESSNLAWRIILEFSESEFKVNLVKKSVATDKNFIEILDAEFMKKHIAIANVIKKVVDEANLSESEIILLKEGLEQTVDQLKISLSRNKEVESTTEESTEPTIKLTTISGSKGMSAGFVFIINMNDGEFPKDPRNPSDDEICQLLVALTRTRKQCYFVSNKSFGIKRGIRQSSFIRWINQDNIEEITADAAYFRGT